MMTRRAAGLSAAFMIIAVLTGCFGSPRTETIIIPDETAPSPDDGESFAVKTIYRLLEDEPSLDKPLGWLNEGAVLGLYWDRDRGPSMERVNEPFETRLRLRDADEFAGWMLLSPDGRYFTSIARKEDGNYKLKLVSLPDQTETAVSAIDEGLIRTVRLAWSSNGRFLAFAFVSREEGGSVRFGIYEPASGEMKSYLAPEWQSNDTLVSVHISDGGQSAAIVKASPAPSGDEAATAVFGSLSGNRFVPEYGHAARLDSSVEWMRPYQIAFAGPDGSLYAYDSRNGSLAVLLEEVGQFRLSPDKASIAYSRKGEGDSVYAAAIHGNNVLNEKLVYRNIRPARLIWSPDGGKLLISGWKPYERSQPSDRSQPQAQPQTVSPAEADEKAAQESTRLGVVPTQNLIVEFR